MNRQTTSWKANPGLPIRKLAADPNAHVIMTPQLREWLARKAAA